MNTMKTLMLAGFTALSLGMGTAMAQVEGGSTYPVAPVAQPAGAGLIQSGSSDVTPTHSGAWQIPTWRDLPTYGGQG